MRRKVARRLFVQMAASVIQALRMDPMQIFSREKVFETPWFSVMSKRVSGLNAPHYSIDTLDYVNVLAIVDSDRVLLVEQYRPAPERMSLELPAGHVEPGESPERAALRELEEETGYTSRRLVSLGSCSPDTGRMANRMWSFFVPTAEPLSHAHKTEDGLRTVMASLAELRQAVIDGRFGNGIHMATLQLAVLNGCFRF